MKLVENKTDKPVKVPLGGGRVLHLGPRKTGHVAPQAIERPSFRRLVDAGQIEVLGDAEAGGAPSGSRVLHESTRGHRQPKVVVPSGNRSGESGNRGQ